MHASQRAANVGVELAVNLLLPLLVFHLARPHLGDAHALIASAAPPLAWSVVELVRKRRVDALSLLILAGIALSLLAFLGGGGVRVLQLREKLVTGFIGLIFLGSAALGRPLIYELARASLLRASPEKAARLVALRDTVAFRRAMSVMTLAWGVALVGECALSTTLALLLPIEHFLWLAPLIGYASLGAMTLWTYAYARRCIGPALRSDPAPNGLGDPRT
jgi:hypothetical protein